jgi:uncharacterized protein YecE (DUF72 family)
MGQLILGCSGWNYGDTPENGGWTEIFYPDANTKRLRYYSQFFDTVEIDSTFYEKFYSNMTKGTFIGMSKATPEKFQFVKLMDRQALIYLHHQHLLQLKLQLMMAMTML